MSVCCTSTGAARPAFIACTALAAAGTQEKQLQIFHTNTLTAAEHTFVCTWAGKPAHCTSTCTGYLCRVGSAAAAAGWPRCQAHRRASAAASPVRNPFRPPNPESASSPDPSWSAPARRLSRAGRTPACMAAPPSWRLRKVVEHGLPASEFAVR